MKPADLLAAARRILWQTWAGTGEEVGSAGAQALIDAGMLVPPGGAAELERLRLLLDAQPVELSEEQLGALIAAGNGALSDYYHERQCACSEYPASCATNPAYRREFGYWDTDAFAIGLGAALAVWEVIRADAAAAELAALRARVAELESLTPARWQTCRDCGSGFEYGKTCSTCSLRALMAEAATQDPCHPCGCPERFDRHADGCPAPQRQAARPRGASEIKHPTMRPTREHLAKNPMPEQRKDGAA